MAAHAAPILNASVVEEWMVDSSVDPAHGRIPWTLTGSVEVLLPQSPAYRCPADAPVECLGSVPWETLVRMDHENGTWTWNLEFVPYRVANRPAAVVVLVWLRARCEWKRWASPDWRTCGHPCQQMDRKEGNHRSLVTEAVV